AERPCSVWRSPRRQPARRGPSTPPSRGGVARGTGTCGRTSTTAGLPTASAAGGGRATSSATSASHPGTITPVQPPGPLTPDPRPAGAYQRPFGPAQATRLLQRAGFGAVPGQAEQLATLGLVGAVRSLPRPSGGATLHGPAPVDGDGNPIAPADAWGHDHL